MGQRLHIRVHKQHTKHDVCSLVRYHSVSPSPGADLVDYLEPNELQLEELFPCIWNPWVTVIAFRVSVNVIFKDLLVAISPFGSLNYFSNSTFDHLIFQCMYLHILYSVPQKPWRSLGPRLSPQIVAACILYFAIPCRIVAIYCCVLRPLQHFCMLPLPLSVYVCS